MNAHQTRPAFRRESAGDARVFGFWGGTEILRRVQRAALDLGPTRHPHSAGPYWHENAYGARTTTHVSLEPVDWR